MSNKLYKKVVLLPIEVAPGKYCWEFTGNRAICGHFDNEGGHSTCTLGFHISTEDDTSSKKGVLKPFKCLNLSAAYNEQAVDIIAGLISEVEGLQNLLEVKSEYIKRLEARMPERHLDDVRRGECKELRSKIKELEEKP